MVKDKYKFSLQGAMHSVRFGTILCNWKEEKILLFRDDMIFIFGKCKVI